MTASVLLLALPSLIWDFLPLPTANHAHVIFKYSWFLRLLLSICAERHCNHRWAPPKTRNFQTRRFDCRFTHEHSKTVHMDKVSSFQGFCCVCLLVKHITRCVFGFLVLQQCRSVVNCVSIRILCWYRVWFSLFSFRLFLLAHYPIHWFQFSAKMMRAVTRR